LRPQERTFYGAQGLDFASEARMKLNWWHASACASDNAEKCHCIECGVAVEFDFFAVQNQSTGVF